MLKNQMEENLISPQQYGGSEVDKLSEDDVNRVCFQLTWLRGSKEPIYEKISGAQFDKHWAALEKCPAI